MSEPHSFDAAYPERERFPRQMRIELRLVSDSDHHVRAFFEGRQIGDDLTDNNRVEDGYRFHDVFHIAFAAFLNWSPILRRHLGRKRRSNRVVDEVEDGGRAAVIEEGIVALIFDYAQRLHGFENASHVLPTLIDTIQGMTAHLEVRDVPALLWERAILDAYHLWRQVLRHQGGLLIADLDAAAVVFEPLVVSG